MKQGSLFCHLVMIISHQPTEDVLDHVLGGLWKALDEEGELGGNLVPWHLDLWCKSS